MSVLAAPWPSAPNANVHLASEIPLAFPLHRYREAFPSGRRTFVLDGARAEPRSSSGPFSLLGTDPFLTFRAVRSAPRASGRDGAHVVVEDATGERALATDDPFAVLRALLRAYALDPSDVSPCPLPLVAGAVGYVGYECHRMLERMPDAPRPSFGMPDVAFGLHDWLLGHREGSKTAWISVVGRGETRGEARRAAERTRDRVREAIDAFERRAHGDDEPRPSSQCPPPRRLDAVHHLSRAEYIDRIAAAKAHIEAGDAFEICLTRAVDVPFDGSPWALFRRLRARNPAPFAAYLELDEGAIVSSSPERFVRLDAERVVESRPIKGTRPRGATDEEDARLAEELRTSPKDRAENTMIVDLVRNDLGRICRYGTVDVPSLCAVERYETVHQLVSTVRGELEPGNDALDVVTACFPPGSMTGAPKIEAMRILDTLEPVERGVYSGGLGYVDFRGTMDLSVVIRTIVVRNGVARVQVGGAIVADSEADAEYEETVHKAAALLDALEETTREGAAP